MKKYTILDLRTSLLAEPIEVEASSIDEALRIAFPDEAFARDYTNTGDILVKIPCDTRYGVQHRTYVYRRVGVRAEARE